MIYFVYNVSLSSISTSVEIPINLAYFSKTGYGGSRTPLAEAKRYAASHY
jgi:hypothetical protein